MRAMNMGRQAAINTSTTDVCTGTGPAHTASGNRGGAGQQGSGSADCLALSTLADGSLSLDAEAKAGLLYMIEEEKMARDLYDAFAEQTGSLVFDRISNSEQRHFDSLLLVAQKAGIDVSGISTTAGVFANTALQGLYATLLTQGSESFAAALQVGIAVENADIADLAAYASDASIGIVGTIYANLNLGSEHHLAAFSQQAALLA